MWPDRNKPNSQSVPSAYINICRKWLGCLSNDLPCGVSITAERPKGGLGHEVYHIISVSAMGFVAGSSHIPTTPMNHPDLGAAPALIHIHITLKGVSAYGRLWTHAWLHGDDSNIFQALWVILEIGVSLA